MAPSLILIVIYILIVLKLRRLNLNTSQMDLGHQARRLMTTSSYDSDSWTSQPGTQQKYSSFRHSHRERGDGGSSNDVIVVTRHMNGGRQVLLSSSSSSRAGGRGIRRAGSERSTSRRLNQTTKTAAAAAAAAAPPSRSSSLSASPPRLTSPQHSVKANSTYGQLIAKRKQTIMICLISLAFYICQIPIKLFQMFNTFYTFQEDVPEEQAAWRFHALNIVFLSAKLLFFLHGMSNPIIYNLMSSKFHQSFRKVILCKSLNYSPKRTEITRT